LRTVALWIINFGILEIIIAGLIAVNVLTFVLYAIDKRKAVKKKWRISEATLIFFTLACGGIGAFLGMKLLRHKTKHTKFKVMVAVGLIIAFIPAIHVIHGLTLDRIIRYVEVAFVSENWPPELNGYRIAFMADFHSMTRQEMYDVHTELNNRNLDLVLLGGDFSMRNPELGDKFELISQIHTRDGIFGVEGNHDDYARIFAKMERLNIRPLNNAGVQIHEGFHLAGVHDAWNRNPDIALATSGASTDDFVLLLTHNPDITMTQPTDGIDLILAGHTHGGQITFFGIPLYLLRGSISDYGMRFAHGFLESADGAPIFITRGIGRYYNVPRIFARPEVVIFTMHSRIKK